MQKIFVSKSMGAPTPYNSSNSKQKTSVTGVFLALLIGLAIGYWMGTIMPPRKIRSALNSSVNPTTETATAPTSGSANGISHASQSSRKTLSKEEWRKIFLQHFQYEPSNNQIYGTTGEDHHLPGVPDLIKAMGKPNRTQTISGQRYWYYTCSDGEIQLIMTGADDSWPLQGTQMNDY